MDMDYREKILDALDFLQDVCRNYGDCDECPLGKGSGDCMITETEPYHWSIKSSPDFEVWRAFND